IILFCWVAGAIIGFLPLFGWYNREGWERDPPGYCFFTDVMDYSYLVFLYFATIVFPALLMIGFYGYIYHVVLIKIRQKGTLAPQHLRRFSEQSRTGSLSCENRSATQVLRIMVSEKRREAKAAKKLGIIVLFFMLCWMPLYTINCIQAFYPKFQVPIQFLNFTIILSHANSALNPFLYAYHLKEFRLAMKNALMSLCGKLLCGLVNAHIEKDNPLGPMSRSLTMPSLGHVTTVPNPSGKVSIKFRKISRPDEPRSVQISPTNINSMIPTAVTTASRDNLLRTAGGTDKSLTSLSLGSDTSNQLLEIPLQVTTSTFTNNSPKNVHSNGGSGSRERKTAAHNPKVIQTNSRYHSSSSETIENCIITTTAPAGTTKVNNCQEVGDDREKITNTNDLQKYNASVNLVSEKENEKHSYIAEDEIKDEYREEEEVNEERSKLCSATETQPHSEFHPQHVRINSNEETSSESSHNDDDTKLVETSDVKGVPFSPLTKQQNGFDNNSGSNCISLEG
ncbi:Adenosine receptor A2a, partial [Orchesella cincta]